MVLPTNVIDLFIYHNGLLKKKKGRKRGGIIWLAVMWSMWIERNAIIFKGYEPDFTRMLDLIKTRSWSWSNTFLGAKNTFSEWCFNPLDAGAS